MLSRASVVVAFICVASSVAALELSFDFEAGLPDDASIAGDVVIERTVVHGGEQALRVAPGAEITIPVSDESGFGTVSMWVYDSGLALDEEQATTRLFGPLWGLANRGNQYLCFGLIYAPYLAGNDSYGWISTAEGGWGSRRYARSPRSEGWHRWQFAVNNETEIIVTVDGVEATGFDTITSRFFEGFNGIYLRGSTDLAEPLIVDDIEVTWQAEPLTERLLPLPGETRALEDVSPLPLRGELRGQHPRLFFTADDIADIQARCKTTHARFFERLISGADSYLNQMPPTASSEVANDQLMQQWGWWRLQTLAFAWIATGDARYGEHAIEWMEIFASWEHWGSGEETDQSMGAANMLTGMACAYDWCWELMTDEQRERFRDKIYEQVQRICWLGFKDPTTASYWKQDHQNNHMHHRLSGLLLGALAVHGEVPEAEGYASFAADQCRLVSEAFPPDGSSHEGPGYMAFGYSYVIRCFDALRHCTGVDLFAATPGIAKTPIFRAHVLTPGFDGVFNFSDDGGGTYYFNHYLFRAASEYQDPAAQALMEKAYEASPGSFTYFPWDILWYDADLQPQPLEEIARAAWFNDIEIATYRTSWTDPDALAVLLKCGPYGGHLLNEIEEGWVNVAHDHPDPNHFMVFWRGVMWATDDGYPRQRKAGENHNIILVDGEGPAHRGTGWTQPIDGMGEMGRIDTFIDRDGLFAVRGDASEYYDGVRRAVRWLAVVDDRYVVICDYLAADQARRFEWLMHSGAQWREVAPNGWLLVQEDEQLHLQFAYPTELSARVEEDHREGSDAMRLVAAPVQAAAEDWFVAVMSMEEVAVRAMPEGGAMVVELGDRDGTIRFDLASGEVTRDAE